MFKFSFRFLILIILIFSVTNSALAWDEIGHKLTAYIAWEQMSPEVREKVIKILLDAPEDSDLSVRYDAYNTRSETIKKRELFMYAAIWSDVVRNRDFETRFRKYNQSDWHYADIFWKQENGKAVIIADFPEESGKAIPKLYDFENILRDNSYNNEEKAVALAWFLHVGGDIHNPLHNASRVTELEPKGDQGGNSFVFIPRTENSYGLNLHGFWDSIIGRVKPRKNDACDSDYLAPIAEKMMKKYPYSKLQNRLELGNYKLWNIEGYNLLDKSVYTDDLRRNQLPSKKYEKRTFETAEEQLTLAGYRLGETLNRIFGNRNVSENSTENSWDWREVKDSKYVEDSVGKGEDDAWIWTRIRASLAVEKDLKSNKITVDVKDRVVILKGKVENLKQKQLAVKIVQNIKEVKEIKDNIEIR